MPYRRRTGSAGLIFHVLNRAARRSRLFDEDADYQAFLRVMAQAQSRVPLRILAYCIMPNHFHLVVWPQVDGEVSRFMHWLTGTHSKRWNAHRGIVGQGCVYQGRFKAFPIQGDRHFFTVCRYVEQNPLRAGLCKSAAEWRYSSLGATTRHGELVQLHDWPLPRPASWATWVDQATPFAALKTLRDAAHREVPFGDPGWVAATTATLGLPGGGEPTET